jgi:hypothetical protein
MSEKNRSKAAPRPANPSFPLELVRRIGSKRDTANLLRLYLHLPAESFL